MARRRAHGGVPQSVPHRRQLADRPVQLIGLGGEQFPVNLRPALLREHPGDVIQRESRRPPQRDQRQAFEHASVIYAPHAAPADRGDQALFLIEAQRRRRHARLLRHFGDIQAFHRLTSS
ncbi:hypothetical protein D3C81_1805800 [compost metagenome]